MPLSDNLDSIKKKIKAAAEKVNRDYKEIRLIAVTKNISLETIKGAVNLRVNDIGENKIQEAIKKNIASLNVKKHFIGHLQTNKIKKAVEIFDVIHSVDSLKLLKKIDKELIKINKKMDVFVEMNVSGEKSKYGILPYELKKFIKEKLRNAKIIGLMAMVPLTEPEKTRTYFRKLKELAEKYSLKELSMGTTNDFEVAVQEGATMIRVGRGIFGERK